MTSARAADPSGPPRELVLPKATMRRACLLVLPVLVVAAGCRSHQERIATFRAAYVEARFADADAAVDRLIAHEARVEPELVAGSCALSSEIDPRRGDTTLYLMEKSMVQLALGNHDCALDLLRRSREYLDPRTTKKNTAGYAGAVAVDDAAVEFDAADYEHLMVRAMLAIDDLLLGGDDAYAYAIQIDEKQEEILARPVGVGGEAGGKGAQEGVEYNPVSQYDRLAIGAYLVGVVLESQRELDEASKAYGRAHEWSGGARVAHDAMRETGGEVRPPAGTGLVHVLYFGGSGPQLVQGTAPVTDVALSIANWISIFQTRHGIGTLGQAPVPAPVVAVLDPTIPPLSVRGAGRSARTETLLDVNAVARQQLEANMPWLVARAVVRRALKTVATDVATGGLRGDDRGLGNFLGLLANVALTAGERADTRNWTTLPAQLQVARLHLPEGVQQLDLGLAGATRVSVQRGKSSFVVVLQPDLERPASIQVDRFSRVEPEPSPAAEGAGAP